MRLYHVKENGYIDLDHVLFVSDPFRDFSSLPNWGVIVTLAFGSERTLRFQNEYWGTHEHAALIAAWKAE